MMIRASIETAQAAWYNALWSVRGVGASNERTDEAFIRLRRETGAEIETYKDGTQGNGPGP